MKFDFDEWAALYQSDPAAFEARRAREISQAINSASEGSRRRLQGLQFRIELELQRSKTPLGRCVRMSNMMWDSVLELRDALKLLVEVPSAEASAAVARSNRPAAEVLSFKPRH